MLVYGDPGVSDAIVVLACNFLLVPFGSIVMALLRRSFDYWAIFRVRVGSALANATFSVVLVMLGFGFMSLARGALAGMLTTALLRQFHRPPGLPNSPSLAGAPDVLSFSRRVVVSEMLSDCSLGVRELAVGRAQGMDAVGLLGRALGLLSMLDRAIMSALWSIVLPYFSMLERERRDLKGGYLRA